MGTRYTVRVGHGRRRRGGERPRPRRHRPRALSREPALLRLGPRVGGLAAERPRLDRAVPGVRRDDGGARARPAGERADGRRLRRDRGAARRGVGLRAGEEATGGPRGRDPRRAARPRRLPAAVARRRAEDGHQGPARPGLRRLRARGRLGGRPGGPGARGPRLRRRAGGHRRRGLGPGPAARRLALAGRGRGAAAGQGGRGRRGGERRRRHLRRLPQRLDRRPGAGGAATSSTPGRASRSPTGSPPSPSSTRDGAWADALATGLLVLGPEAGRALAARERLAARLVLRQADGTYAEWSTPAFEALVGPAR